MEDTVYTTLINIDFDFGLHHQYHYSMQNNVTIKREIARYCVIIRINQRR